MKECKRAEKFLVLSRRGYATHQIQLGIKKEIFMLGRVKLWSLACLCVLSCVQLCAVDKQKESEKALKGLSAFTLFVMTPAKDKAAIEKISATVTKELKKYGKVGNLELVVQTDKGEAIDLSGYSSGNMLVYKIQAPAALAKAGIAEASLNLSTSVLVENTDAKAYASVWSDSCFLQGSVEDKQIASLVAQSLPGLLKDFMEKYKSVNSEKPSFKIYAP
jgi:hypothetical protein